MALANSMFGTYPDSTANKINIFDYFLVIHSKEQQHVPP
jgi:hypothetical protein